MAATAALSLSAHVIWIESAVPQLEVGKAAMVRIGNGHDIAQSESAVSLEGLQMWVVTPANSKVPLKPAVDGSWVSSEYLVPSAGVYRFVMSHDRGVLSSTPEGLKPGGRDVHRNAARSMKIWRSASAVGSTPGKKAGSLRPLGLTFELVGERRGDVMELRALRDGKPQANADLAIGVPGKKEQDSIGKTDAAGKFGYKVPHTTNGSVVFVASISEPAEKTATFDTYNYSASLYLHW